jgi:hypothetical protein
MNQYLKGFLFGLSLGTIAITIFGAVFQVREPWVTLLLLTSSSLLALATYKSGDKK